MKFPMLEIGTRFRYQGRMYCKRGPIAATDEETGQTRMIPRYARLEPADAAIPTSIAPTTSSPQQVLDALCAACDQLLDAYGVPAENRRSLLRLRDALREALAERPNP